MIEGRKRLNNKKEYMAGKHWNILIQPHVCPAIVGETSKLIDGNDYTGGDYIKG